MCNPDYQASYQKNVAEDACDERAQTERNNTNQLQQQRLDSTAKSAARVST